jgi:hypothetical protein
MDTFVWYSKGTEESGNLIANSLEGKHGKVPPAGFKGLGVCYGAAPADIFKWENRKFRALFNDPRKTRPLAANKNSLLNNILLKGASVVENTVVNNVSDFEAVLDAVGAVDSFYCCKPSGAGAVEVKNQNELQEAVGKGKTFAVHNNFALENKSRVFVVNGEVVLSLEACTEEDKILEKMAVEGGNYNPLLHNKLIGLHKKGLIVLGEEAFCTEEKYDVTKEVHENVVVPVAETLAGSVDMYCIEYIIDDDTYTVTNVLFSPGLVDISEGGIEVIVEGVEGWIEENSTTSKEALLKMAQEATEAEASTLLEAIVKYAKS